jgi:hypothetical protein
MTQSKEGLDMKKLLLQLDSDKFPSVFDSITAYDAGADNVLSYGGVAPDDVRDLVYGAMFTRGGDDLKNSAVFIGGSDVPTGEAMLKVALDSFFGPVRVSVMMDSNGCNTTAIAAVIRIITTTDVKGKKSAVFAGTGPVGMRGAALLAKEGSEVYLTSRRMERAEATAKLIKERFDVDVTPLEVKDEEGVAQALEGAHVAFTAGAAGVEIVPESLWKDNPTLEVLADVNAVPPLGIGGIKATDKGKEREGKIIFGALGIGGLKMKIHRGCVARLFESNELVLEAEEIYAIAKEMGG